MSKQRARPTVATTPEEKRERAENRRFLNHIARLFSDGFCTFGAMKDRRVLVVVALVGTSREDDLERLVVDKWGGVIDIPRDVARKMRAER